MSSLPPQGSGPVASSLPSPISSRPGVDNEFFKSPKSLLNEFCQSMKFSIPTYTSSSEDGFTVTTACIVIEGNVIKHSYQSSEVVLTKKLRKEHEENAAQKAYLALTELYGVNPSRPELQKSQSCQKSGKECLLILQYLMFLDTYADAQVSRSNYNVSRPELHKTPSCPGFGKN